MRNVKRGSVKKKFHESAVSARSGESRAAPDENPQTDNRQEIDERHRLVAKPSLEYKIDSRDRCHDAHSHSISTRIAGNKVWRLHSRARQFLALGANTMHVNVPAVADQPAQH